MVRFVGIQLLLFFNVFWLIVTLISSIDLTVIGHCRAWKTIKYPKWLNGFVDKKHKGKLLLSDCTTHPQVLFFIGLSVLVQTLSVLLCVLIWFSIDGIENWIIWIINATLYGLTAFEVAIIKIKANKALATREEIVRLNFVSEDEDKKTLE